MMVPIFLLGYVYGRIYRWLVSGRNRYGPLGMALATAVLYGGLALESSATKIVGGIAVSSLVAWMIIRFVAPIYFRWTFPDSGVERA
jgi:hypothetical protein